MKTAGLVLLLLIFVLRSHAEENCPKFLRGNTINAGGPSCDVRVLSGRCLVGQRFRKATKLGLKNCKIEEIEPDAFWSMEELRELDLSHNLLEHLPEDLFKRNVKLEWISLRGNKFTTVPYVAVPVKYLDLSRNKIYSVDLTTTLNVTNLDLDFNMLERVSSQDMQMLSEVSTMKVNNNPFKCGSEFQDFACFYLRKFITSSEQTQFKCKNRKGEEISDELDQHLERCGIYIQSSTSLTTEEVSKLPQTSTAPTTHQPTIPQVKNVGNSASRIVINNLLILMYACYIITSLVEGC